MSLKPARIYLASQSPRRRELLKQIGINFELLLLRAGTDRLLDVDETPLPDEAPEDFVRRICQEKAQAGYAALRHRNLPAYPVLAADTIVTLDGIIFGKPNNAEQATEMLRALSGREHQVYSGIAVAMDEHIELRVSISTVRFTELSDERIKQYLKSGEYSGKAGSYAIQGQAGAFVEHLSGSYSGVMGLPLYETVELLRHFEVQAP